MFIFTKGKTSSHVSKRGKRTAYISPKALPTGKYDSDGWENNADLNIFGKNLININIKKI